MNVSAIGACTLTKILYPTAQPWLFAKGCLIEVDWACEVVGNSGCVRWWTGVCTPTSLYGKVAFGRRVKIGRELAFNSDL